MPYVPGAELAGVVRSAPAGSHVAAGDRVAGLTMLYGAMAEVVVLQPEFVFKLPDSVSFEAGAGLLFNDMTMHFALRTRGRLADGETVLVHGAAGGIGTSTLRLAPAFGARPNHRGGQLRGQDGGRQGRRRFRRACWPTASRTRSRS